MTAPRHSANEPLRCGGCGHPIINTDAGLSHVESSEVGFGWLCPPPHMTIARPASEPHSTADPLTAPLPATPRKRPTPIPGTARRSQPPHPGHAIA
ncbi:MAG: hypothetical protein ACRDT8_22560 [Micromonosporaceae bacterium]